MERVPVSVVRFFLNFVDNVDQRFAGHVVVELLVNLPAILPPKFVIGLRRLMAHRRRGFLGMASPDHNLAFSGVDYVQGCHSPCSQ